MLIVIFDRATSLEMVNMPYNFNITAICEKSPFLALIYSNKCTNDLISVQLLRHYLHCCGGIIYLSELWSYAERI